jgi:hypothetical protein
MKVSKLFSLSALFLIIGSVAMQAQNQGLPGDLAETSNAQWMVSSLGSGAGTSAVLPKTDIASVEDMHTRHIRTVWMASIFAMAAGTTADAVSSWHKRESNSLLASSDGTFGGKGVGLKAGMAVGMLAPQIIFRKHRDWHTAFALGNFAEAGIFAGATVHNLSVK